MVKHTQTIRRQTAKGLRAKKSRLPNNSNWGIVVGLIGTALDLEAIVMFA